MIINAYRFGQIIIDGKKYTSDLKIFPNSIKDNWWRKEGHNLSIQDIQDILDFQPEVLIVGTGSSGVLKVPDQVIKKVEEQGIEIIIENTEKACELFNGLYTSKKLVAALHLTC